MDRRTRLQRTSVLCQHTLRNLAYLEAMAECQESWEHAEFWIAAHNNFLDVGILEWCKLFAESTGKHYWAQSISDHPAFLVELVQATGKSDSEFSEYRDGLRRYRNRFLAHLDEDNVYRLPRMTAAVSSTKLLLTWLVEKEDNCDALPTDHVTGEVFYVHVLEHARAVMRGEA